jgi:hypothetical protein
MDNFLVLKKFDKFIGSWLLIKQNCLPHGIRNLSNHEERKIRSLEMYHWNVGSDITATFLENERSKLSRDNN